MVKDLTLLTRKQRNSRVEMRLEALGMSKGVMASLGGWSRSYITHLFRAEEWKTSTAVKVAKIVKCDPRFLIFLEMDTRGRGVNID